MITLKKEQRGKLPAMLRIRSVSHYSISVSERTVTEHTALIASGLSVSPQGRRFLVPFSPTIFRFFRRLFSADTASRPKDLTQRGSAPSPSRKKRAEICSICCTSAASSSSLFQLQKGIEPYSQLFFLMSSINFFIIASSLFIIQSYVALVLCIDRDVRS